MGRVAGNDTKREARRGRPPQGALRGLAVYQRCAMLRLAISPTRVRMQDHNSSWVALSSTQLSAEINPLGAQLSVLRDNSGKELLWNGDPAIWAGRAPLLFPIVGTLAGGHYRLGSKAYPLPRHGFARGRQFEVVAASAIQATFRLSADEATLQLYPFLFQLDVDFALNGATLSITSS